MATSHVSRTPPASWTDPYLAWAVANKFRHTRPGAFLPMMVEFNSELLSLRTFAKLEWLEDDLKSAVTVPSDFVDPPPTVAAAKDFSFCVLLVDTQQANAVTTSLGWRNTVRAISIAPPLGYDPTRVAPPPPASSKPGDSGKQKGFIRRMIAYLVDRFSGRRSALRRQVGAINPSTQFAQQQITTGGLAPVAVAVLDEGIAFAHAGFLIAGAPRIKYYWNQNTGVIRTGTQLQSEITKHVDNGLIDEDAVYRAIGGLNFRVDGFKALARRRSHGTHVLGLAAELNAATSGSLRPLLAIELPEQAIGDPAGYPLYTYIFWGIFRALNEVQKMAAGKSLPVVCNVSYGPTHGPHDGSGLFERAIDQLIVATRKGNTPLDVVLAAGNFKQARVHAVFALSPNLARTLHWRLQPEDLMPNFLEIWVPKAFVQGVTVKVTLPDKRSATITGNQALVQIGGGNGGDLAWLWLNPATSSSQKRCFVVAVQPTATDPPLDPNLPVAPSGLWEVDVTSTTALTAECWIWLKSSPARRRSRSRQSYFDVPDYDRSAPNGRPWDFDPLNSTSPVTRRSTLSGIATGKETVVIGAYRAPDLYPSLYSSHGSRAVPPLGTTDPSWLEQADRSPCCQGVLSLGSRSGSIVSMSGTSVAAPQATRRIAEMRSAGIVWPALPAGLATPPTKPERPVPAADAPSAFGNGLAAPHPHRFPRF